MPAHLRVWKDRLIVAGVEAVRFNYAACQCVVPVRNKRQAGRLCCANRAGMKEMVKADEFEFFACRAGQERCCAGCRNRN